MTCRHLRAVEAAILAAGIRETSRGSPWSENCREWVYFDCFIDTAEVLQRYKLAACVKEHVHRGTHEGNERGLVCQRCHDAIMGHYERGQRQPVFPLRLQRADDPSSA